MEQTPRAKRDGRCCVATAVICLAVCLVLGRALSMIARSRGFISAQHRSDQCMTNLQQLGTAMLLYSYDWDGKLPTNRAYTNRRLGPINDHIDLMRARESGKPVKSQCGPNWVEALWGEYIRVDCIWRCPSSTKRVYPTGSETAAITYVFNRNLVERSEKIVRNASTLMMIREIDGLVNAELRPVNDSTDNPNLPPESPFLTDSDCRIGNTNPRLHGEGSHVLFVDGHVALYHQGFFAPGRPISKATNWDPAMRQWYNFCYANPKTSEEKMMNMSIAITP